MTQILDLNDVRLIGEVSSEIKKSVIDSGVNFARFNIKTTKKGKKMDGSAYEATTYHKIVCWGKKTDLTDPLNEGDRVYIYGSISNRSYKEKETGKTLYVSEVSAIEVAPLHLINSEVKDVSFPAEGGSAEGGLNTPVHKFSVDDIPF